MSKLPYLKINQFKGKNINIVQFTAEDSESAPHAWVAGELTQWDWMEWMENHPYRSYTYDDDFVEYVEAFLKSTGLEYGFIVPDLIFYA